METKLKNLPNHFKPEDVLKGNQGEEIVAHLLRKDGYYVTCLSDIRERGRSGAPGATTQKDFLTLPDLQASSQGYTGYCEVKWKTRADFTRITQREEHGIDKICWDHYQEIRDKTGLSVFLFIYERKTGAVLYENITTLGKVKRYTPKMGRGGMIFFPRATFNLWGRVVPLEEGLFIQLDMFRKIGGNSGDKLFGLIRHKGRIL